MENDTFLRKTGMKIKLFRIANDLTLDELAVKCGYHRHSIAKIERGEKDARLLTLKAIADVFGIEVKDFL
ncbi:MAG: helix-turn-helix transcriptional regulator [Chitinophagales bacterium]